MLEKDETEGAHSSATFVQESKEKIDTFSQKLQRLLDSYLDQDIEREVYIEKKASLMSEKKSLEERSVTLEQQQTGWIEPLREWIKEAQNGVKIARGCDLMPKKVIAKKLFGSNLLLSSRNLHLELPENEGVNSVLMHSSEGVNLPQINKISRPMEGDFVTKFHGKNPWEALQFARLFVGKIPECLILVALTGIEPVFPD